MKAHKYDLYEFNMHSFTWTQIDRDISRPEIACPLLTATTADQLVLQGINEKKNRSLSTWILNNESNNWEQLPDPAECDQWCHHTATTGSNNDVINVYDRSGDCKCNKMILSVMLEPRALQQVAVRIIYENRR